MYAFQIERVTHFSLMRQNASLCGRSVRHGIELSRRQGPICPACSRIEFNSWVSEWHRNYGVLGPIPPIAVETDRNEAWSEPEKRVA